MHKPAEDPQTLDEWADDQLKHGMRGNDACLPCHEELRDSSALRKHTHHEPGSSGSTCYNCHMPFTTYGLLKGIRAHTISNPSVLESVKWKRPNACNLCHLDRTLAWSGEHLQEWYGQKPPELSGSQNTIAASILWLLTGDAGQRALTVHSYGWKDAQAVSGTDWMLPFVAPLLVDPYDAVRYIAYRTLRTLPGCQNVEYDFLGPEEQRDAAIATATQNWRVAGGSKTWRSELLFDSTGRFARRIWQELIAARDNRRVNLEE